MVVSGGLEDAAVSGVWQAAMRLTYTVEISLRPYFLVAMVEGRISRDLCDISGWDVGSVTNFVSNI